MSQSLARVSGLFSHVICYSAHNFTILLHSHCSPRIYSGHSGQTLPVGTVKSSMVNKAERLVAKRQEFPSGVCRDQNGANTKGILDLHTSGGRTSHQMLTLLFLCVLLVTVGWLMSCHVIVRNHLSLSMGSRGVAAGANPSLP